MFFAATSLLAHHNKKITADVGIHKLTYHALAYYFLFSDNELKKYFLENYKDSYDDAEQLLHFSELKALGILENFKLEHKKRSDFTYEIGKVAQENKAKTSITRAEQFFNEVQNVMKKK